jgi:hypothetical protein
MMDFSLSFDYRRETNKNGNLMGISWEEWEWFVTFIQIHADTHVQMFTDTDGSLLGFPVFPVFLI